MNNADEIREALTMPSPHLAFTKQDLLSTSSTLLNLALTGQAEGGLVKGRYFFFVGDSDSGKTFIALSMLAEATINPNFDDYRLIHDDIEGGVLMDIQRYFGKKVVQRLEPPKGTRNNPKYSADIEDFYCNLDDIFEDGSPFLYFLDSQDALSSRYSDKKFQESKEALQKGREAKGDYGDGKAKMHSTRLRQVCSKLRDTGSILVIINQTRDNIGGGLFSPATIYSGGRALKFYSCAQIWTSTKGKLTKTIRGKPRQLGIQVKIAVKKNRLTGKEWTVEVPIYHSYGVDDIGSCVDYLIDEKHWKKKGRNIIIPEFEGITGTRDEVVKEIEEEELQPELREIVQDAWKNIESACTIDRKSRYE